MFKKITPKRPSVVRKDSRVQVCYLYHGMKECLGPQCFWIRVGTCPTFNRLKAKKKAK